MRHIYSVVWRGFRLGQIYSFKILVQFNSLPINKILEKSTFKAFSDDKRNVDQMMKYGFDGLENIMGKAEDVGYQYVLLFPLRFKSYLYKRC